MELRKVTAIVRALALERVERGLREIGVPGLTVTRVKGYGEYANFFSKDWMTDHVRIEIFTAASRVDRILEVICSAACTGEPGDGIIAVLPVEHLYRIRDRANADLAESTQI